MVFGFEILRENPWCAFVVLNFFDHEVSQKEDLAFEVLREYPPSAYMVQKIRCCVQLQARGHLIVINHQMTDTMKTVIATLVISIALLTAQANDSKKRIATKIDRVTVFQSGAQVFRKGSVELQTGITEVVFTNLSPNIVEQTLRVTGKGEFVILEVKKTTEYPEPTAIAQLPTDVVRKIKSLTDSLADADLVLRTLKAEMDALVLEHHMLKNNKLAKGEGKSDSLALFVGFMTYFRKQMTDIDRNYIRAERDHARQTELRKAMNERLIALKNYRSTSGEKDADNGPDHQVVVTLSADKPGPARLELSYAVTGAGWEPLYDLRAENADAPLNITYKAQVRQNTGEDWNNVRLTLSTNNPNRNNTRPTLNPWVIGLQTVYRQQTSAPVAYGMAEQAMTKRQTEDVAGDDREDQALPDAVLSSELVTANARFASVEFEVPLPYTISANNEPRLIAIRQQTLPTDYFHYLVPKLDRESYIVARTTGWQKLDLLPGTANIYYEGTYIGQTAINPYNFADTVEFALGRDPRVTATWERIKDETKGKPLAHDRVITRSQRMAIANRTGKTIKLLVDDQIPVTALDDIRVDLTKPDGGKLNATTGTVRWEFALSKPEKELRFEFSITLPKERQLSGL